MNKNEAVIIKVDFITESETAFGFIIPTKTINIKIDDMNNEEMKEVFNEAKNALESICEDYEYDKEGLHKSIDSILEDCIKEKNKYEKETTIEATKKYKEELIQKTHHPDRLDWVLDNEEKEEMN